MYARDISTKVRTAKRQRARQGLFIASQPPYGYCQSPDNKNRLVADPEAASVVTRIFSMAECGLGNVAIARELEAQEVVTPSVYKFQKGDKRFARYSSVRDMNLYAWCPSTVSQILNNPVYTGTLVSLKTETIDCKTKQRRSVPKEAQIVTHDAHEAIITREQFDRVRQIREAHRSPANNSRDNIFRGKLYCQCCGHPLSMTKKQLLYRTADIYQCMHHYLNRKECPQTHRVYHEMLYPYVLQEIQRFAKTMKRRKINAAIKDYVDITELTPEILNEVIERIEIAHVARKSKPGRVIQIYWKF
jgi:hypothetical protein